MEFKMDCAFAGFIGNKAVISQGGEVRLVEYYRSIGSELKECCNTVVTVKCILDENGKVWISGVEN